MGEISSTKQEYKLEETRTQTGSGIGAHIQQISQQSAGQRTSAEGEE